MENVWIWNDIDDMYCTIAGFILIVSGYFLIKSFWKWWEEVKDRKHSVSQSNAIQGVAGGVILFVIGLMFFYYSFILPFIGWLKQ